ncbi:MAG: metal-dependent transcriptional regulator [Treponemataceae bacterium]|nr:MAG: metal-dependent transcriptional regulator [Treponemataceae bacterium]
MYESGENYLETILILHEKNGFVRASDIAKKLGFSRPSVSRAMGILKQDGYIDMTDAGTLTLTQKGREKAGQIYVRHKQLTDFLMHVTGVDSNCAEENACRIEHVIDDELFTAILKYLNTARGKD